MINELSYRPCEFLVISFSRSAVAELKHRLQRMIGNKSKEITVSTFHALSYHSIEGKLQVSNNYDLEEYQYLYLKELERSQTSPYRYIFVDEYQDINQIQHDIVMVLSKYSKQLMVVGDLAQNIYKFRHSDHRYLRDFHSFVGDKCTDIRLDINYRSNQGLVEASNQILKSMSFTLMKWNTVKSEDMERPILLYFGSFEKEIDYIVSNLKVMKSCMILSRTKRPLYALEEVLIMSGIDFYFTSDDLSDDLTDKGVILSTIHASKGLESDMVFLINMTDTGEITAEDVRLFYVAMTRAKKRCFITYSRRRLCLSRMIQTISYKYLHEKSDIPERLNLSAERFTYKNNSLSQIIRNLEMKDFIWFRNHKNFALWNHMFLENSIENRHNYDCNEYLDFMHLFILRMFQSKLHEQHNILFQIPSTLNTLFTVELFNSDYHFYKEKKRKFLKLFSYYNCNDVIDKSLIFQIFDTYEYEKVKRIFNTIQERQSMFHININRINVACKTNQGIPDIETMAYCLRKFMDPVNHTLDLTREIYNLSMIYSIDRKRRGIFFKPYPEQELRQLRPILTHWKNVFNNSLEFTNHSVFFDLNIGFAIESNNVLYRIKGWMNGKYRCLENSKRVMTIFSNVDLIIGNTLYFTYQSDEKDFKIKQIVECMVIYEVMKMIEVKIDKTYCLNLQNCNVHLFNHRTYNHATDNSLLKYIIDLSKNVNV